MDDLVDCLPKKPNGQAYKRAVLKIDIEGFEPLAFARARARRLFDRLDIPVVLMEWKVQSEVAEFKGYIDDMVVMRVEYNYEPVNYASEVLDNRCCNRLQVFLK